MSERCATCHDSEWVDNGCGVVPCVDCSVSASTHRAALAAVPAHTPGALDVERLARAMAEIDDDPTWKRHDPVEEELDWYYERYARELLRRVIEAASPSEETR